MLRVCVVMARRNGCRAVLRPASLVSGWAKELVRRKVDNMLPFGLNGIGSSTGSSFVGLSFVGLRSSLPS